MPFLTQDILDTLNKEHRGKTVTAFESNNEGMLVIRFLDGSIMRIDAFGSVNVQRHERLIINAHNQWTPTQPVAQPPTKQAEHADGH